MSKFSTILTALDLSEMDTNLVRFTKYFAEHFKTEKIYFTHVVPDFTLPGQVEVEFHKRFAPEIPVDEIVVKKVSERIAPFFSEKDAEKTEILTVEGRPYRQLLHWVDVKHADLVVVGKKKQSQGSGITASRLTRNLKTASVLFVSDSAGSGMKSLLVPVDFSENSSRALQKAIELKNADPEVRVKVIYVIDYPPTGFYLNREEYQGFNKMLMDTAKASFTEFLNKYSLSGDGLDFEIIENAWHNIAGAIAEYAGKNPYDLILIGAQGHSRFESFLFGSVTENLVVGVGHTSILVIR